MARRSRDPGPTSLVEVGLAEDDVNRRRVLCLAVLVTGCVAIFAVLARRVVQHTGLSRPRGYNIYFRLFALHELPHQLLLAGFVVGTLVLIAQSSRSAAETASPATDNPSPRLSHLVAIAFAVAILGMAT